MEDKAEEFRRRKKCNQLLLVACARGYLNDVEGLTEEGADLGCRDKRGLSPLHFAAGKGHLGVVQFLWSKGAELDAEAPDGRTPLHLAAQRGHTEVARFLIQKGAWADAEDAQDNTPLHLAARAGHVGGVQLLVEHGAAQGPLNKRGLSPAGEALLSGHDAAVAALKSWGAELAERPHGFSLLHLAAGVGRPEAVEHLLELGLSVNDSDNDERATPLHAAALSDRDARCAELLLAAGADASLTNAAGELPADLLQASSASPEVARLQALLRQGPVRGKLAARPAAASSAAAELPAAEAFRALPLADRLRKVERWSVLGPQDLEAVLRGYPTAARREVQSRLAAAGAARSALNVHQAMAALHADEEFQSDMADPKVASAIDAIKGNTALYEQAAADPQLGGVLAKMRRAHAAAQANGQRTVSMEDMVVKPDQDWQAQDAAWKAELEGTMQAHFAAAAAAAAAEGKAPAEAAAEAFAAAAAEAAKAKTAGGEKDAGVANARSRKPERSAAEEPGIEEDKEDRNMPEWMRGGFTWQKVWASLLRQTLASLAVLLVFLLGSWLVRGQPPWVGGGRTPGARQAPLPNAEDVDAAGSGYSDEL